VAEGFAVARYHPDGKPDMTLQSDGKLVVVGASKVGDDCDFAIARLNENGTPDNSFGGSDGRLTTGFGDDEAAKAVAIQANGRIVVAGHKITSHPDASFVARYLPDGDLDPSLNGDGQLTIPNDGLNDLALQPDGKFVVVGQVYAPD
jgi:uncharacterized delta-60 repeat protein